MWTPDFFLLISLVSPDKLANNLTICKQLPTVWYIREHFLTLLTFILFIHYPTYHMLPQDNISYNNILLKSILLCKTTTRLLLMFNSVILLFEFFLKFFCSFFCFLLYFCPSYYFTNAAAAILYKKKTTTTKKRKNYIKL